MKMAAYAALTSLTHIIDRIQSQTRHSASVDKKQIESLLDKVAFFHDFLEDYTHGGCKEAKVLESQIKYAAYAAEDAIESHVVDQILAGSSFMIDLRKVLEDMDSVKEEVMEFKDETGLKDRTSAYSIRLSGVEKVMEKMESIRKRVMKVKVKKGFNHWKQPTYCIALSSSRDPAMVGFDDDLIQLMERLVGQHSNTRVIPIVGMGGIGKTTLARNVYENSVIVHPFDVRAWVTISHNYNVRGVLLELLSCFRKQGSSEDLVLSANDGDGDTEDQFGEQLYKSLSGRRYLIVMDDIWSVGVWDSIRMFFPDNGSRSRIVVTTRLSNVATHFGSWFLEMDFLDDKNSWDLFCEKTFAPETCPPELEEVGKRIVGKCKGLPLSIVVIGGLLGKSNRTREHWENVAEDINSILNSRDDRHCLDILSLSYNHLPAHLKPCFLYMGIFPEDHEIHVSQLIKLWVAEGFLKPSNNNSLEDVAVGYLKDLIDRNLILVRSRRMNGKIKTCIIHDILRGICLKVAQEEKFLCVMTALDVPRGMDRERRIVYHESIPTKKCQPLQSASNARSLICKGGPLSLKLRLLRVLNMADRYSLEAIFRKVNLRYLAYMPTWRSIVEIPSSISLLWNLQTLIIRGASERIVAPSEIWEMPQLRHLELDEICLPDPPPVDDFVVLENLQTLLIAVNLRCTHEVVGRIPNVKKLKMKYDDFSGGRDSGSYYCLHNLGLFQKLESLNCLFYKLPNRGDLLQNLKFPNSLKKLTLKNCNLRWEDLSLIGSLPRLEALKLKFDAVMGPEWSPVEGEFLCLKFLQIYCSCDLIRWNVDSSHFPVLEKLVLDHLISLEEIPSGIGDIPTLRSIHLRECEYSFIVSAKKLLEELQSMGNDDLMIRVWYWRKLLELQSENFQVETVRAD